MRDLFCLGWRSIVSIANFFLLSSAIFVFIFSSCSPEDEVIVVPPDVDTYEFTVVEGALPNTDINPNRALPILDLGGKSSLILQGDDVEHFVMKDNGVFCVAPGSAIDYERRDLYTIQVIDREKDGDLPEAVIYIRVKDRPPGFGGEEYVISLPEGGEGMKRVPFSFIDFFVPVSYTIESGESVGLFEINDSGQISVAEGMELDYDTQDIYTVMVRSEDVDGKSDTVAVNIEVRDIDLVPVIRGYVSENATNGTSVFRHESFPPPYNRGEYEISTLAEGWTQPFPPPYNRGEEEILVNNPFMMDSGVLTVRRPQYLISEHIYSFRVRVESEAGPIENIRFSIEVLPASDPEFQNPEPEVMPPHEVDNSRDYKWTVSDSIGSTLLAINSDGLIVAINQPYAFTSSDGGQNWDSHFHGTRSLKSMVWGAGKFVAVGDHGAIISSSDGIHWDSHKPIISHFVHLRRVIYGNGKFIAGGRDLQIFESDDGMNWKLAHHEREDASIIAPEILNNVNYIIKILWYPPLSRFFAYYTTYSEAAKSTEGIGLLASSDGITWTNQGLIDDESVGLHYDFGDVIVHGEYIYRVSPETAQNQSDSFISRSTDGINWESLEGEPKIRGNISPVGDKFLILGGSGGYIVDSDFGLVKRAGDLEQVIGTGIWTGTHAIVSTRSHLLKSDLSGSGSPSWIPVLSVNQIDGQLWSAWGEGDRWIVAEKRKNFWLSTDGGMTWGRRQLPTPDLESDNSFVYDMKKIGDKLVGVGQGGSVWVSENRGDTWRASKVGSRDLYAVAGNGSMYVAVGTAGSIVTTSDLTSWDSKNEGSSDILGVVWTGRRFVAVGDRGTLLISSDGGTWIRPTESGLADSDYLKDLVWTGSQLVAVGLTLGVFTSPNGSIWTRREIINPYAILPHLYGITWTGRELVVVGHRGLLYTSDDAETWTSHNVFNVFDDFIDVEWTGDKVIFVGRRGGVYIGSPLENE